jgi:uncharacterized damage-inducible protein DinB
MLSPSLQALYDEYQRAAAELAALLRPIDESTFGAIADPDTSDPDCVSIQAVMRHVLGSGYVYAQYIRDCYAVPGDRVGPADIGPCAHARSAEEGLDRMLTYTKETLEALGNPDEVELMRRIIDTRWGQRYDLEQMLEHAIVHVLRHRRQIEHFTKRMGP